MSALMDWKTALWERRSIRRFEPQPVPRLVLTEVLEAACQAPSAHNSQPWRFCVVEDGARKAELAAAMGARLEQDRRLDGDDEAAIQADVERSFRRITGAPVVIVLCLTTADLERYGDARRAEAERIMGVQSVAMAGENLLLAAHALGLGACWLAAPLFAPQAAKAALGLPPDWEPQGLVLLGYAAETGKPKTRWSVEEVTRWM